MSYTVPQTTATPDMNSYLTSHDLQHTPIQSPNIDVPAPAYPGGSYNNDKAQYAPQQQQGMPPQQIHQADTPQQTFQHLAPVNKNNYQIATPLASLQQSPAPVDCPVCGVREMTRTEYVSGGTTHLSAALCCVCLCLGCVPYLGTWFKDVEHMCGHCGVVVAVWHRSGRTEVLALGRG